jgi:hypothetical protein
MSDQARTDHFAEDDLVLHYYGESPAPAAVEAHLAACVPCRSEWASLCAALDAVTDATAGAAAPRELSPADLESVWLALRPRLVAERQRRAARRALWAPLAAAAALVFAFLAGRHWPTPSPTPGPSTAASEAQVRERVLLVAVGDHLERSQMLLVELANAPAGRAVDIGPEQERAQELVGDSRLYRQAALRAGEPAMASVLDELERLLVEVAHAPEQLRPAQLEKLQRRIEARGLLFKVRVLESRVRQQQKDEQRAPVAGAVS